MGFNLEAQSFHFACFACRKSFKKHVRREVDFHTGHFITYTPLPFACPNCGRLLSLQGRDFAAPRTDKPHRWRQMRQQVRAWRRFGDRSFEDALERSSWRRRDEKKRARMDARIDREKLQMQKEAQAKR